MNVQGNKRPFSALNGAVQAGPDLKKGKFEHDFSEETPMALISENVDHFSSSINRINNLQLSCKVSNWFFEFLRSPYEIYKEVIPWGIQKVTAKALDIQKLEAVAYLPVIIQDLQKIIDMSDYNGNERELLFQLKRSVPDLSKVEEFCEKNIPAYCSKIWEDFLSRSPMECSEKFTEVSERIKCILELSVTLYDQIKPLRDITTVALASLESRILDNIHNYPELPVDCMRYMCQFLMPYNIEEETSGQFATTFIDYETTVANGYKAAWRNLSRVNLVNVKGQISCHAAMKDFFVANPKKFAMCVPDFDKRIIGTQKLDLDFFVYDNKTLIETHEKTQKDIHNRQSYVSKLEVPAVSTSMKALYISAKPKKIVMPEPIGPINTVTITNICFLIVKLSREWSELEKLEIGYEYFLFPKGGVIPQVVDENGMVAAIAQANFAKLQCLTIINFPVTDNAFITETFFSKIPSLKKLTLKNCNHLTEKFLEFVPDHITLETSLCNGLTKDLTAVCI